MSMADASLMSILENMADPGRRMEIICGLLRPPEPQLLDTCILQNLDWVDRQIEEKGDVVWDDGAVRTLATQYGREMAVDLIDLGMLHTRFEHFGGYPWLVCETNFSEGAPLYGGKGERIRKITRYFYGHQEDLYVHSYPGTATSLLTENNSIRVSPMILKGLGVETVDQVTSGDGPLSFLHDYGDRLIAHYAIIANIPIILTTDRRTFWKHRDALKEFGVHVMRPSELLDLYEPYWAALSQEFERRRL